LEGEEISLLQQFVFHIQELNNEEWLAFAAIWQPFSARRKEVLTREGDTEKYLYFVLGGVQRAYYSSEEADKEATLVFTYPYSFSGVADSFLLQLPSKYYLETLTASSFLRTDATQLRQLMDKYRNIERLIRIATELAFAGVIERQIELQCFSAEERFKALLQRSPQVLQLIPHKYLASYLGMDATTFSKLLGSVKIYG
jgi:CRP-like cAMP-binding protein